MEAEIKEIFSNSRTDCNLFMLIFTELLCALRAEWYVQPQDSCLAVGVRGVR